MENNENNVEKPTMINPEVISLQFKNIQESLRALKEGDIKDIKADIREIKDESPSRREFDNLCLEVKEVKDQYTWLFRTVMSVVIGVVVMGGILAYAQFH